MPASAPASTPHLELDASLKGYPGAAAACALSDIGERGWNVLAGDMPMPLAVLRESALIHNTAWMQDYARRHGVYLAPHGKTSMSPQLLARQLAAGAWGLTFANVTQAQWGARAGAQRLIIANQVLGRAELDALDALLAAHPGLRLWFLLDSRAQLACIEQWAQARQAAGLALRAFDVLLELGLPGLRTGCRDAAQALELARAAQASAAVRLCGIECYEGLAARCDSTYDQRIVSQLVRLASEVARACDRENLWADGEAQILLTAGGSAVFDLVLPLLRTADLSRPVVGVLRSGCYIVHDHGSYARFVDLILERDSAEGAQGTKGVGLQAGLTVWAQVQSVPEPGLALLGAGRRDLSFDSDMPRPLQRCSTATRALGAAPLHWRITALNDQHAHMHFDPQDPSAPWPQVGEIVELGISHPCTTFDKWRWLAVVDEAGGVIGGVQTQF